MSAPNVPARRQTALHITAIIAALVGLLAPLFAGPLRAAEVGSDDFRISFQGPGTDINYTAFTPEVAYNSVDDEYLVAWVGTIGPGAEAIYIQRVDADGTLLPTAGAPAGTPVRASVNRNDQIYDGLAPSLAYNPDRNEYLLVYRQDDPEIGLNDNQYEIYGQFLAADGTAVAPFETTQLVPPTPFADVMPNGTPLSPFRISFMNADSSSTGGAFDPAVAYSPDTQEYLVVWWGDKEYDTRYDIRARFVGERGALLGTVDMRLSNQGPNPANISYDAYDPAVAYSPASGNFLVVWSGNNLVVNQPDLGRLEGKFEIYGQLVSASTRAPVAPTPGGLANVQISRTGPDNNLFFDARTPAVAAAPDGRFFVAWQGTQTVSAFTTNNGATDYNQHYEAYGRLIAADGTPLGDADIRLSTMGADDDDPRFGLVNGPRWVANQYADYLINDQRGGTTTYYSIGGSIDVAYDAESDEFVTVWASDDDRPGSTVNATEIFAQRVRAADGAEVGIDDQLISSMGPVLNPSYDAHNPAIAYGANADELLVVWAGTEELEHYEIYGQRLAHRVPRVLNVDSDLATADNSVSEGELIDLWVAKLMVQFSEAPAEPNRTASYLVVGAGPNGVIDTTSCSAAEGDDVSIMRIPTFNSANNTVTLSLNNGVGLPTSHYRLIICGTGPNAIVDSDGDALDGDGDGVAGGDFVRNFTIDRLPPVFNQPPDIEVITGDPAGTTVNFDLSPYVSDTIDSTPTITCNPASGSFFSVGAATVTCSASDDAGNISDERSFQVQVLYQTVPTIDTPGDLTVEATGPGGANVTYSASASDTEGPVPVSCNPASGELFSVGDTTVTCTASNNQGQASASFVVTVQDTTAPALDLPSDLTLEASSAAGAIGTYDVSAIDLVDGPVSVICTPASGSQFPLGETTVDCEASDSRSNLSSGSFTVTVVDTQGPVLSGLNNIIVGSTSDDGAIVNFNVSAEDAVDGPVSVICTPASGSQFPLGETTVDCEASDSRSNLSSGSFTVTVRDERIPTLVVPADLSVEATSAGGAVVSYNATASDASGPLTPSCSPASGSFFGLGDTTVTCSVTGTNGMSVQSSFVVSVVDTVGPVLNLPADMTVEATSAAGAVVSYNVTASDVADPSVSVSCAPASGGTFGLGTTTVTCTATDDSGNQSAGSFKVTVRDTKAPQLSTVADLSFDAEDAGGATVNYQLPQATDTVDGALAVSCTPPAGSRFPVGTTTVTCTATDSSGNQASVSFKVTVRAFAPPAGGHKLYLPSLHNGRGPDLGGSPCVPDNLTCTPR